MSNLSSKQPTPYEPKKKNRWLINFPVEYGIQQWWLSSAYRPSYQIKRYGIFGITLWTKYIYKDLIIEFRDPIVNSASSAIYSMIEVNKPIDLILELLNPTGEVVEKWSFTGCRVKESNFGRLSMDDDSICDITLSLSVGKVKLLD
jgi:hypothetical protein